MTTIVDKYVDLNPEQAAEFERLAQTLGLSASKLIQRCIEQGRTIYDVELSDEEKHLVFQKALDFMDERARQYSGPIVERTWTREDAYEDYKVDAKGNPISD